MTATVFPLYLRSHRVALLSCREQRYISRARRTRSRPRQIVAREPRMTREEVEKALAEMERLREASRLADDVDEQRQYANDYHRLWRLVRPYVDGEKSYSEKNK